MTISASPSTDVTTTGSIGSSSSQIVFKNARVYDGIASAGPRDGQDLLIDTTTGRIVSVGGHDAQDPGVEVVDMQGKFILPAFIDSHVHLSMQGDSLDKVDLEGCTSLAEVQGRISREIESRGLDDPTVPQPKIQAKGFTMSMLAGESPLKEYLDQCSTGARVIIVVHGRDLHSSWLSSAALAALNITSQTPDPSGGKIERKPGTTEPSGLLDESAHFSFVWKDLPNLYSHEERLDFLRRGMRSWLEEGVGSVVDMSMDEGVLNLLKELFDDERKKSGSSGRLPLRIACHWLVQPFLSSSPEEADRENLAQVQRAKTVQRELEEGGYSPYLRIAGIKLITDGVIDSCTASLHLPYYNGTNADPIWPAERLFPVVALADKLDLQCAIHAIGDLAVDTAIASVAFAVEQNGPNEQRRHRIEHLELTRAESVPRMKKLGIIASVQAVHANPAVQDNWQAMLGHDDRCSRAFAYGDFLSHGVPLALGTDAPTAPHSALLNLYIAHTRKSPYEHQAHLPATTPQWAIPLLDAVLAATSGAAWAAKWEKEVGQLEKGYKADFTVLSLDVVEEDKSGDEGEKGGNLLKAKVLETWVGGTKVFDAARS